MAGGEYPVLAVVDTLGVVFGRDEDGIADDAGFVEETEGLLEKELKKSSTSRSAFVEAGAMGTTGGVYSSSLTEASFLFFEDEKENQEDF